MNLRKTVITLLLSALLGLSVMFTGCADMTASEHEPAPTSGPGAITPNETPSAPASVSSADKEAIANDSIAFAFDLYQQLRQGDNNLVYSPHSVFEAFAMLQAGARNQTEAQIAEVMHFTLPQERLHPAVQLMHNALVGSADVQEDQQIEGAFELSIANALWGQKDYPLQPAFTDTLSKYYGAGMHEVDFQNEPEPARNTINNWVEEETAEKIKDLLPQDSISSDTRMVLTNAVYFNADWLYQFSKETVQQRPFTLLNGEQTEVPMMQREIRGLRHSVGEGYQAVELPYIGNDVSMVIIMPDNDTFNDFEDTLDAKSFAGIVGSLSAGTVDLSMPKFNFESGFNLNDTLAAMGMTDAFEHSLADLSGITGDRDLYVSNVFHKALVAVDEQGTEAAAATAIVADLVSAPAEPEQVVNITIDHPFIFAIRDMDTGALLFVGRVLNPSA